MGCGMIEVLRDNPGYLVDEHSAERRLKVHGMMDRCVNWSGKGQVLCHGMGMAVIRYGLALLTRVFGARR